MFNKSVLNVSVAAALLLASGIASADTGFATTHVPVSASVTKSCTISATALAFGVYDPIGANATAPLTTTGSVIVICAKNSGALSIGMGLGGQPAGLVRQMASGSDRLRYDVGQPPNNTPGTACSYTGMTAWTDSGGGLLALTDAPSKASRTYNVCGSIPAGQDAAAGIAYTDTIIATINF